MRTWIEPGRATPSVAVPVRFRRPSNTDDESTFGLDDKNTESVHGVEVVEPTVVVQSTVTSSPTAAVEGAAMSPTTRSVTSGITWSWARRPPPMVGYESA